MDRSCLEVLSQIEKSVNKQDVLEKINLALKSIFLWKKKALVEVGKYYLPLLPMTSLQCHVPRQICLTIFVKERVPARGFSFTSN